MKNHTKLKSDTTVRKRDQQLHVWLSKLERSRLESKAEAHGQTLADFIRGMAEVDDGARVVSRPSPVHRK